MILFINACVRSGSRTKRLADALIEKLNEPFEEVRLEELELPKVDEAFLAKRDGLIESGCFEAPLFDLARRFAGADRIVIAAPYWDLSFPAALKQFFEHINVLGITFRYTESGFPIGLCRASTLYYVSTAGGSFVPEEFGYGYVKALANSFYGIKDTRLIIAKGLDIAGADAEKILDECIKGIFAHS